MLPIQQFFIQRISQFRLTKTEIAKKISQTGGLKKFNDFFNSNDPDIETAKKISDILCMTEEEFEELWYQTKDQAVRKKIKARISNAKTIEDQLKVA